MKRLQSTETLICATLALVAVLGSAMAAGKDIGPTHQGCDGLAKSSPAWRECLAAHPITDNELFYAGYWLAKTGHYRAALEYLRATKIKDARIETYIGFATRKLGDVTGALKHYTAALEFDPSDTVARSYLGEAYLALKKPDLARAELSQIEMRCGKHCKEYTDLSKALAEFVRRKT